MWPPRLIPLGRFLIPMTRMLSLLVAALLASAACGPLQVEVRTAPASASDVALLVTNNLTQPVNVYYNAGGGDVFLRQVDPGRPVTIPVRSAGPGTEVSLKATTIDGGRTYTRRNVVLTGVFSWNLP